MHSTHKFLKLCITTIFLCNTMLNAMNPEATPQQRQIGAEKILVQTSDHVLMEVPFWQIEQMGKLHKFYLLQLRYNAKNREGNPLLSLGLTAAQLKLLQDALEKAYSAQKLEIFYKALTPEQQSELLNAANTVEATGLELLLATLVFPQDIQTRILNASQIVKPIIDYLKIEGIDKKYLKGHHDSVYCVAFSPDGNYIVSGSGDRNLILWNSHTGKLITTLQGHQGAIACLAFSPDGNYIVSGSYDKDLILWDGHTGKLIKKLAVHQNWIICLAFSPDGNYIVSGSYDTNNNLILWNGHTGKLIKILEGHQNSVRCVAFSPDGNYIVSESYHDGLFLWDGYTGKFIKKLEHQNWITCLAFSPKGDYIVSGSYNNNPFLRDGYTGELIKILEGHQNSVRCVAFSPDGNYIVSGSDDDNLILWNGHTGELIKTMKGHQNSVRCVAFSPDGNYIASASMDDNLILWDGHTGELIKILHGHQESTRCVAFSPDSNSIISGSHTDNDNLILWKFPDLSYIKNQLTISQARFLYRLYLAKINNMPVAIDKADLDYTIFKSLPDNVQKLITQYLPFTVMQPWSFSYLQEKLNALKNSIATYKKQLLFGLGALTIAVAAYKYWTQK